MVDIELVSIRKGILTSGSENSVFGILVRNINEYIFYYKEAVSRILRNSGTMLLLIIERVTLDSTGNINIRESPFESFELSSGTS